MNKMFNLNAPGSTRGEERAANQAAIRQSRSRAIVGDLATAFVPLLLLYLLGWSIGWIRRGFVQP